VQICFSLVGQGKTWLHGRSAELLALANAVDASLRLRLLCLAALALGPLSLYLALVALYSVLPHDQFPLRC
jgi:hypothetical protein